MGQKQLGVLTPDDLNDTDGRVLDVLHEGRVTPQYVADALDVSRTYASERLKRLVEHNHVDRLASGLYELVDDPREEDSDDELTENQQLRKTIYILENERDDLDERFREATERIEELEEQQRQADIDVDRVRESLDRALNNLPEDVPGRMAVEDAHALLEDGDRDD